MKFTFVCREHDDYGNKGWVLKNKPWFEPLSGMAVAHDCLEHFPDDTGRMEDELQALGAMLHVRYAHWHGRFPLWQNMTMEIVRLGRHYHEGQKVKPLKYYPHSSIEDDMIQLQHELYHYSEYEESLKSTSFDTPEQRKSILAWVTRGYRRALRRYPKGYVVGGLFKTIEERADKLLETAELDSELVVSFNFNAMHSVRIYTNEPY